MILAMARLIDARDVLDPDGMTRRGFNGQVVGYYKCTGANSWDPYKFVPRDSGVIEVLPGLKIQLERTGPRFRMRRQGKVIRVEWVPGSRDVVEDTQRAKRALFLERYVATFDEPAGKGGGFLASRLIK